MYDKLIKDLRIYANDETDELRAEAADAIENISKAYQMMAKAYEAEVTKQWWIPVEERLPERGQNVLVANKRGKQWDIDKAWLSCLGSGFDRCGKRPLYNVTHWMPLPEPPKEERMIPWIFADLDTIIDSYSDPAEEGE